MSIHQMNAVWRYSKNKGSKLLLLLAIADNADDDGVAFPGVDYLAKKIRMSERHVTRMIRELGDTNELAVVWGGGRGNANLYYILLDKTEAAIAEIKAKAAEENAKREATNPDKLSIKGDKLSANPDNLSGNSNGINPDKLSVKGDKLSIKGDKLSVKGDKLSIKGDIAMSPEPSEPIREPPSNHQEPDGLIQKWPNVLQSLQGTMTQATFDQLLRGSRLATVKDGVATLVAPSQYAADWINGRLKDQVGRAIHETTGRRCSVYARPPRLGELYALDKT